MEEVRCPGCERYICSAPEGTPVRAYCRPCKLKFEITVRKIARVASITVLTRANC